MSEAWYLAGPMTGVPQFNFPLFDSVAATLRAAGRVVINPAELDGEEVRAACLASPHGSLEDLEGASFNLARTVGRDVQYVLGHSCGLVLLPNWERSKGARVEAFTALTFNGHDFELWLGDRVQPCTRGYVQKRLIQTFGEMV